METEKKEVGQAWGRDTGLPWGFWALSQSSRRLKNILSLAYGVSEGCPGPPYLLRLLHVSSQI